MRLPTARGLRLKKWIFGEIETILKTILLGPFVLHYTNIVLSLLTC
jgi:hypothetical protein